ncbi:MAG TPA: hypothetical protein VLK30_11630 [Candidatus Limnocylindrales bacterium]|nr:hypothetical protein [Candidatus Limnocylindrales bacterium]
MTAADARVPQARLVVIGAGLAGVAALLWLTRTYLFYFDEWTFITTAPSWTWSTWFEPHNEQPSMLLRALYWLLLNTAGLRTYVPYMAVTLAFHFASVLLIFELVRRRASELIGVGAALLLLVLGAGWEDVLWAFQMAWLASVALGLGALLIAQRPARIVAPAVLIAASLSFSAVGAAFAIALTVQVLSDKSRRRQVWWLVGVAVTFAAWYATFGRQAGQANRPSATNLLADPAYALWGLSQSLAGLIGEGGWIGAVLLVGAVVALAWRWTRHGADGFAIGVAAGLVAFYLLTGLTRAQMGWEQAGASRYVYVGAVLWLLLLADAAKGLPWRGTWRPALVAVLFLACFNSAVLMFAFTAAKTVQMEREAADLQALAAERTDSCLDPAAHPDPLVMPQLTAQLYYPAVDHYGDPIAGRPNRDRADFLMAQDNLRRAGC